MVVHCEDISWENGNSSYISLIGDNTSKIPGTSSVISGKALSSPIAQETDFRWLSMKMSDPMQNWNT